MKPRTIAVSIHHEDETGNIITLLDNLTVIYDYRVITDIHQATGLTPCRTITI